MKLSLIDANETVTCVSQVIPGDTHQVVFREFHSWTETFHMNSPQVQHFMSSDSESSLNQLHRLIQPNRRRIKVHPQNNKIIKYRRYAKASCQSRARFNLVIYHWGLLIGWPHMTSGHALWSKPLQREQKHGNEVHIGTNVKRDVMWPRTDTVWSCCLYVSLFVVGGVLWLFVLIWLTFFLTVQTNTSIYTESLFISCSCLFVILNVQISPLPVYYLTLWWRSTGGGVSSPARTTPVRRMMYWCLTLLIFRGAK